MPETCSSNVHLLEMFPSFAFDLVFNLGSPRVVVGMAKRPRSGHQHSKHSDTARQPNYMASGGFPHAGHLCILTGKSDESRARSAM